MSTRDWWRWNASKIYKEEVGKLKNLRIERKSLIT
jgi:hypothetical protein